jgi:intracellular septation protein
VLALKLNPVTWAAVMGTYGTVSKITLFLIQYATMRFIGVRRRRAQMTPIMA